MSRAVIAVPETENGVAQYISQNCKGYVAKTMAKQLAARYGKDAIRINTKTKKYTASNASQETAMPVQQLMFS